MTDNNSALVIGLGMESQRLLRAVKNQFDGAAGVSPDTLELLWLPPVEQTVSFLDDEAVLPLRLRANDLESLFFDEQLRRWCAPNWFHWNEHIIGTRLWGQLAIYNAYDRVYRRLNRMVSNLNAQGRFVNIYLVAHAHDPFASGAFIDLAYLIEQRLPAHIGYRSSGLLILPETDGDPHSAANDSQSADSERPYLEQAISYALLRELNFYQSTPSFYENHQRVQTITGLKNQSPFQTGDCYLLGGSRDIAYEPLLTATAHFIYLQTVTAAGDEIPSSPLGDGLFSTFGLRREDDLAGQVRDDIQEQRDGGLRLLITQLLSNPSGRPVRSDGLIDLLNNPLSIQTDEGQQMRPVSMSELDGYAGYQQQVDELRMAVTATNSVTPDALQSGYRQAIEELVQLERTLNTRLADRLNDVPLQLKRMDEWFKEQSDGYLANYDQSIQAASQLIQERYDALMDTLPGLESKARSYATRMRQTEKKLRYMLDNSGGRWSQGTAYALIGLGTVFLFLAADASGMALLWGAIGTAFYTYTVRYRGTVDAEQTRAAYVQAILALLDLQESVSEMRAEAVYLSRVRTLFIRQMNLETDSGAVSFPVASLLEHLETIQDTLRGALPQSQLAITGNLQAAREAALTSLLQHPKFLTATTDPDSEALREVLLSHVEPLLQYDRPDAVLLDEYLSRVQSGTVSTPALQVAFAPLSSSPGEQIILGLQNWDRTLESTTLTGGNRVVHLPAESVPDGNRPERGVDVLRVVTRVRLSDLERLSDWRVQFQRLAHQSPVSSAQGRYMYLSFFHPRRLGVVVPAIQADSISELQTLPHLGMMLALLLDWLAPAHYMEDLYSELSVQPGNDTIDELCGALQEHDRQTTLLLQEARLHFQEAAADEGLQLRSLRILLEEQMPYMERNEADWQLWAVTTVLADLRDRQSGAGFRPETTYLTVLAHLYYYFSKHLKGQTTS